MHLLERAAGPGPARCRRRAAVARDGQQPGPLRTAGPCVTAACRSQPSPAPHGARGQRHTCERTQGLSVLQHVWSGPAAWSWTRSRWQGGRTCSCRFAPRRSAGRGSLRSRAAVVALPAPRSSLTGSRGLPAARRDVLRGQRVFEGSHLVGRACVHWSRVGLRPPGVSLRRLGRASPGVAAPECATYAAVTIGTWMVANGSVFGAAPSVSGPFAGFGDVVAVVLTPSSAARSAMPAPPCGVSRSEQE